MFTKVELAFSVLSVVVVAELARVVEFDPEELELGKDTLLLGVDVVAILCFLTLLLQCKGSGFD